MARTRDRVQRSRPPLAHVVPLAGPVDPYCRVQLVRGASGEYAIDPAPVASAVHGRSLGTRIAA